MKKDAGILLIVSIFIVISLFVLSNFQEPAEPKNFVKNKTFNNYSTLFFNFEVMRYPSNVEIKSTEQVNGTILIGFVTDPWNINFGVIPGNGTFVTRNIELTNKKEVKSKIILKAYGNITPLISFSKNNFVLKPHEKVAVDIFLFSNQTVIGNYTGEIDVIAQKSIYIFLPID